MKADFCVCPDCRAKLEVDGIYGPGKCPQCGCRFTVFRDSAIRIDVKTPFWSGTFWLSFLDEVIP